MQLAVLFLLNLVVWLATMAATGYSYDVYQNWDFIPIAVLAGVAGLAAVVLALLNLCLSLYGFFKGEKVGRIFCEDIVLGVSKLILDFEVTSGQQGNNDQRGNNDHQGNNDRRGNDDQQGNNDQQEIKVHGRKVPVVIINLFFAPAVWVCVCAFITFWVIFLVEESFGCDPRLDCFPWQDNNSELLSHTPIQNCSDYDRIDNVTIICYQFVFQYAEGFGAAGGILVFAASLMKMYEIALFWAVDLPVTKDGRGSIFKRVIKWIVIISVLVTPLVCSGVTVGVSVGVPLIRDTIFKTESLGLSSLLHTSALSRMWQ